VKASRDERDEVTTAALFSNAEAVAVARPRRKTLAAGLFLFAREQTALIVLAILVAVGGITSPVFFSYQNFINIFWIVSVLGIIALGQTMLLLTGNFDMSVAYTVGLAGIVTVMAQLNGAGLWLSVVLGLGAGAIVGGVNGAIVAITGANPFLITLGTSTLVYSINLTITQAKTWYVKIPGFAILGQGKVFESIQISVVLFLAMAFLLEFLIRRTPYGRSLYIIGLNQRTAWLSGIRTNRIKLATFILCGVTAAFAGLVMTSRTGSTVGNAGAGMDFESLIASVLGGTSLFGGRGGTARTVVGVLVLGVLDNLLILLNTPYEAQQLAKGGVFILVVWIDSVVHSK
jgi:ribose/xylose/arabinose/galactoside ABC-type transport system permease subunit